MDYKVGDYSKAKMKDLVERDAYIRMAYNDMIARGDREDDVLKILYNSEVLDGNQVMQESYDNGGTE